MQKVRQLLADIRRGWSGYECWGRVREKPSASLGIFGHPMLSALTFLSDPIHKKTTVPRSLADYLPKSGLLMNSINGMDEACYFLLRHAANPITTNPVLRRRRDVGSGTPLALHASLKIILCDFLLDFPHKIGQAAGQSAGSLIGFIRCILRLATMHSNSRSQAARNRLRSGHLAHIPRFQPKG